MELKKIEQHKLSWGAIQEAVFVDHKEHLKAALELSHVKEKHNISVFMEAFDKIWAGVVTQVEENKVE